MSTTQRDIHELWKTQPREEQDMPIAGLRARAEQFEGRIRRWSTITAVLFTLIVIAESWQIWRHPELLERVGDALTVAALAYVVIGWRRYARAQTMPADLGRMSALDFYREQLTRHRNLANQPWRYLVLFIPGVSLSLFGDAIDRPVAEITAIAGVAVALFLAVAWFNSRTARDLQNEIDELKNYTGRT